MTTCSPPPKRHPPTWNPRRTPRSEEHTSELQSQSNLVCRLLLEKKKTQTKVYSYSQTILNPHYSAWITENLPALSTSNGLARLISPASPARCRGDSAPAIVLHEL